MTGCEHDGEHAAAHPKGLDAAPRSRADAGSPERRADRERQRADRPGAKAINTVVFDLDGTLVDSDEALIAPFVRLGVPRERISLGRLLAEECAAMGVTVEDYLDAYVPEDVQPFPGIEDVLARLPRWAVASHKVRESGVAELTRLGWEPACAFFAEDFNGRTKHLEPVLDALGVSAEEVVFVGDTDHDRHCARAAGATFALAAWNPRAAASAQPGDVVLRRPAELLDLGVGLLAG